MLSDLRKLRHVIGVADAGSFTAASTVLALSQSALTKSVAEVEHQLNIKLFRRLSRGVKLTEAGELFVERSRRILADTDDLMSSIDKLHDLREGRLRIGVGPAAFTPLIEEPIADFAKIYPGIRVEVIDSDLQDAARALAAGHIDVVVGEATYLSRWQELDTRAMTQLHTCFIARPDHPSKQMGTVEVAELLRYPVVVPSDRLPTDEELANVYARAGLTPREPQYRCNSMSLTRKLVLNTDAIAPLVTFNEPTPRLRREFLVFDNVIELREYALGVAMLRQREQMPAVLAFRDIFTSFGNTRPSSAS